MQQFQFASLVPNGSKSTHQFADSGAIEETDIGQIQKYLLSDLSH